MRYKLLGKTGLRVSELCLGTMTFGEEWGWGASKEESRKIFDAFADAGGNFVDTANLYTGGTSEKFVGEFLKGRRERFVLATKYTLSMSPDDPNGGGNHRKSLVQSLACGSWTWASHWNRPLAVLGLCAMVVSLRPGVDVCPTLPRRATGWDRRFSRRRQRPRRTCPRTAR